MINEQKFQHVSLLISWIKCKLLSSGYVMEAIGENMDSDFWAQEMIISLAEWAYLTISNEKSSSDAQVRQNIEFEWKFQLIWI